MLTLTRGNILSRMGGHVGARGLMRTADSALRRELRAVRSSEIVLSSFTFGVLQGRFKDKGGLSAFSVPVDLLAGAVFHIMALFPFAKPYAHHMHAFGDGALASFFTTTGYRVGERMAKGGSLRSGLSGLLGDVEKPVSGGATLADEQLKNLVQADS